MPLLPEEDEESEAEVVPEAESVLEPEVVSDEEETPAESVVLAMVVMLA